MKLQNLHEARHHTNVGLKFVVKVPDEKLGELLVDILDAHTNALIKFTDEEFGELGEKLVNSPEVMNVVRSQIEKYISHFGYKIVEEAFYEHNREWPGGELLDVLKKQV